MDVQKSKTALMNIVNSSASVEKLVHSLHDAKLLTDPEHETIMDAIIALFSAVTTIRCDLCREHLTERFQNCQINDRHLVNTYEGWQKYQSTLSKEEKIHD